MPAEPRDRIVLRHRAGEGYKKVSAALKVLKNSGLNNTLEEVWNNRRALVREVTKNLMVILAELLCGEGRNFQ